MIHLSLVLLVAVCSADPTQASPNTPERLSLEAASAKVAAFIREQHPTAQLGNDFAVVDRTTDAVWDRLRVQVLRVEGGAVEQGESYVLHGDNLIPIGRAFGGEGVTSIVAADLAGDQRPLLVYAFAWGSGIHRSEIGILELHGKAPKELRLVPINYSQDDYALRRAEDGGVEVLRGKTLLGRVVALRKQGVLEARIDVVEK